MMKNQVLSIEQMKHLKELGVDTSGASMVLLFSDENGECVAWEVENHGKNKSIYEFYDDEVGHCVSTTAEYFDSETGNYDHSFREECGVFTLQDILNAMPKTIEVKDERLYLTCDLFDESNKSVKGVLSIDFVLNAVSYNVHGYEGVDFQIPYAVRSYPIEDGSFYHEVCNTPIRRDTLLESVYLMLCWLVENGYLKQQP